MRGAGQDTARRAEIRRTRLWQQFAVINACQKDRALRDRGLKPQHYAALPLKLRRRSDGKCRTGW